MKALFCLTAVLVFAANVEACGMFSKSRSGGCSSSRSSCAPPVQRSVHCSSPAVQFIQPAVQVPLQVPLKVQVQVIPPPPVTIQVPLQVQVIPQVAVQQFALQPMVQHVCPTSTVQHSCPPAQRSKIRETFKSREVFKGRASHY